MYHYIYVYIIAFLVISFVAYEFQPEFGSALIIVARMGEGRGVYRVLVGNRRERDHWGDLGVDGWIILGWISRRWDVGIWNGLGWPRIETGGGHL